MSHGFCGLPRISSSTRALRRASRNSRNSRMRRMATVLMIHCGSTKPPLMMRGALR
jgi:hypothetical protein